MRLREKVSLIFIAVIIYKTACSLSLPQPAEENPFEKYIKAKRGKVQSLPKHALYGTENGRKSMDVLSDSAILNELRKEKRRKRKNRPTEKVYSRDDLPTPSLPDIFRNQEQSFYFNEMGSFPEVQYPLTASETWAPSYWNLNKQEVYSNDDYGPQNNKQKKKKIQAFHQPSIMKTMLKELEKNTEKKLSKKFTLVEKEKHNETIAINNKNFSLPETNATQSHTKMLKQPLTRKNSLKKIVPKVQQASSASKKLLNGKITSGSKSKQVNQETESKNRVKNKQELGSKKKIYATNISTNLLSPNKNSADALTDSALINTIKTIDLSSSHISTDEDSNQLELLLAVTVSETSLEERNNANSTVENQMQTSSTPDMVLFSDSVRQSIFDVLSTKKLNASSLRNNILKILLAKERQPADTLSNKDILKNHITDNLTSGDNVDLRVPVDSIIVPSAIEEFSEKTKNVSFNTLWTLIHENDNIEATELIKPLSEKQITEDATRSSEIQTTSSIDNVTNPFSTNYLADNLRGIISKPSDSHALVDDWREIIRLLTLWNSLIEDAEEPINSKNDIPVTSKSSAKLIASTKNTDSQNTKNNKTDDRPENSMPTNGTENETSKQNHIDNAPLVQQNSANETTSYDWTNGTPVVALSDQPLDDMSFLFLVDIPQMIVKNYQPYSTIASDIIVISIDKQGEISNDDQPAIDLAITLIEAATDDQTDKNNFNLSDNQKVDVSDVIVAVTLNHSLTSDQNDSTNNTRNDGLSETVPKITTSDISTDMNKAITVQKTSADNQSIMIPLAKTNEITIKNQTDTHNQSITMNNQTDMAPLDAHKTTFNVFQIEKTLINGTAANETIDKKHTEKPRIDQKDVVFDPISVNNNYTLPTKFLSSTSSTTVSSLAQEYSDSLLSFILNYLSFTNILSYKLMGNPNKTRSDSELLAKKISDGNNKDKKADLLNKNLFVEVPDKNSIKLKPNDLDDDNPANKTIAKPSSENITMSNNDSSTITPDQHFDNTLSDINSPTRFTFNDILYDKNDTSSPILLVTTYLPHDNELIIATQGEEKLYLSLTEDFIDENILEVDKESVNDVCPIMGDTSLEGQCYIHEQPDAFNRTGNLTDMSGEWLTSNVEIIKSVPEDYLNKDSSISKEMLDFTDYYTISPEDTTTDFHDLTLSSESIDTKNYYHKFTAPILQNEMEVTTNKLLDEVTITEDSGNALSNLIGKYKAGHIVNEEAPEIVNEKTQKIVFPNLEHDAIERAKQSEAKSFDDGVDNSIHESYPDEQIVNDSKNVLEYQDNHDLYKISHDSKKDEHNKLITDKPLLWGIFPKLEFLL